jgi:uncharacterized protein (TIGR02246 family)
MSGTVRRLAARSGPMASFHRALTVIVALACLIPATSARSDPARNAVDAGNRAFIKAFLQGNATAVANLYTPDAQVIAPGSPVARGRSAIAAFWQKLIDSGVKDVTLETAEVESAGDLAYETGIVRLVAKDGTVSNARYVVIWKRTDGEWLLHRDTWNSSQ